ncbi:MAG: hypothetical protein JWR10_61 [Rubritepida sp.]|nr:hypothetical protein [Rubritepida sp.]
MSTVAGPSARLFREPDFVRLWCVGLIVFLVRWLEMLAVSLFVYEHTGSAFLVAMLGMLRILPMGLFGAVFGAMAERIEHRTALVAVVLISLMTSISLALLARAGMLDVWHLALASFVNGLGWAADNPVRRMMIGQVVGAARMGRAMSADVGSNNASRMVGPTVSGIIFAVAGIEGTFLISIALYLVGLYAALTLRYRSGVPAETGQGFLERIGEGLALVRGSPRLKGTLAVTVIFNVFGWPFTSLVPIIARDHLQLAPEAIGVLSSMDGVGAFVGALLMAAWVRPELYRRCYMGGISIYFAMLVIFSLAPSPVLAGMALFLTGFGQSGFSIMQATLVYMLAPAEMRSRILGLLSVCIGLGPIGFLHLGLLAEAVGSQWACVISGTEGIVALALTRNIWRKI